MKTLLIAFFSLVAVSGTPEIYAQKPAKVVISIPGAQDEACKTRIENYLKREYGVTSSNVNYRRNTVTIQYLTDRTNAENLKTALANLGYDADDVKANPESYKRLPKTCQHPVKSPKTEE